MPDPQRVSAAPSFSRAPSSAATDAKRVGNKESESALAASDSSAVGFVLAGGQSSRMGQDKALLHFAGRPLVAHALSILSQAGLSVSIAGARPSARTSLEAFAPVVEDPEPGLGPLAGICAALASTAARYAVFLPVDLPLLPPALIAFLAPQRRNHRPGCYRSCTRRL